MPVAIIAGVSWSSANDNEARTSGSFTPAANDLLVAFGLVTGQASGGTFTDSQGLGWTQVTTALKNSSGDTLVCAVANALAASSSMTVTFTPAGSPTSTGFLGSVLRVSGMSRTGSTAVSQSAKQENQSSAIPTVTFGASYNNGDPLIGSVGYSDFIPTVSPPGGGFPFTERHEINIGPAPGPAAGIETCSRDSAVGAGNQIQWGGTVNTAFGAIGIVLDIRAPAPTVSSVSANSGPAAGGTNVTITGTGFTATPTVTFGGQAATNVAFVNSTTLTCTTPAHAAGAVNVVVTNPDTQTGTGTDAFTYLAASTATQSILAAPTNVSPSSSCYSGFGSGSGFGI